MKKSKEVREFLQTKVCVSCIYDLIEYVIMLECYYKDRKILKLKMKCPHKD